MMIHDPLCDLELGLLKLQQGQAAVRIAQTRISQRMPDENRAVDLDIAMKSIQGIANSSLCAFALNFTQFELRSLFLSFNADLHQYGIGTHHYIFF